MLASEARSEPKASEVQQTESTVDRAENGG
jgi:hypothetical protein